MRVMNKKNIVLILISFFIGCLFMIFILLCTPLVSYVLKDQDSKTLDKSSIADSVKKIYDAVVVVEGYNYSTQNNTGTGFIYKKDSKYGYIITNEHVLSNSSDIKVVLSNDKEVKAELLGKDEYLDLAILRIPKKYVSLVATIGKSSEVSLGDTIFTVGSPVGYEYRGSVTSGVLSGRDRLVSMSLKSTDDNDWIMKVLQIDASINPGNSGGPLLNANGEVIGICSLKLVDDDIEGMGFAIPIEYAMSFVDTLEEGKEIEWPTLGIDMVNVSDSAALFRNHIDDTNADYGVAITSIKKNSNASKSNLQKGDIIIKIEDTDIKDIAYLRYELYQHHKGDRIEITYLRNGKKHKTKVTL